MKITNISREAVHFTTGKDAKTGEGRAEHIDPGESKDIEISATDPASGRPRGRRRDFHPQGRDRES
jgi:hypothetical protein